MDSAKLLVAKIKEYENIIIAKHKSPDWDAVGSAEGLREIIKDNFDQKNVYVVGDQIDSNEKIDDHKLTDDIISSALLITVDTANIERVDFADILKAKETFRVDHHINNTPYTDNEIVFDKAIACTQVVTLWARDQNLKISKLAAEYLYRGLLTDSNRFSYKNTDEKTFEAAITLVGAGIDIAKINQSIFRRTLRQARWNNEAFSRVVIDEEVGFAYIKGTQSDVKQNNLTQDEFKSALGTMANIDEIDVWAFIYEVEKEDGVKISLRSKKIDINKIAVKYGGGGHKLASGGYLSNWDELEDFLIDIKKYIQGERENGKS